MERAIKRGGEAVRRTVISILLCLSALCLGGCGKSYEWNQKLTVTVETPSGDVSGSAVTAISWNKNFFSGGWGGAAWHSQVKGEAVVVDLGGGRMLFALLSHSGSSDYIANLATRLVMDTTKRAWSTQAFAGVRNLPKPAQVPPKLYPLLVTFADINDPKTVTKLDPANLAAAFGPGYALKGVTLEITDEAVTTGAVEKVLEWLGPYPEAPVLPNIAPTDFSFEAKLRQGSFIER
jgi:hypothetical protein